MRPNILEIKTENSKMINYADDTKIYLSDSEPQVVERGINQDIGSARLWFKENGMMPNPKKYQVKVLGNKGYEINFQCAYETIPTLNDLSYWVYWWIASSNLMHMLRPCVAK